MDKIKIEVSEIMSLKHMLARMSTDPSIKVDHMKEMIDIMSHEQLKDFTKTVLDIILELKK